MHPRHSSKQLKDCQLTSPLCDPQVLWPQVVTLGVMLATVVLTLKVVSGNVFMAFILAAQVITFVFSPAYFQARR